MNREEAQFILAAYRPNGEDAHDPQFQEALALARQDPILARWFADEQALDRAFAAKIRARPTPVDLKAQLLLARSTSRTAPRWRRPVWLAAAAGFVVLLVVAGTWQHQRTQAHGEAFDQFRRAMAATSVDMSNHAAIWGLDAAGYRRWLSEHRGDPDFVLPAALAEQGISACKVVEWEHRRVTMLCFKFSGQHVDVFVVNASDLPGISLDAMPAFFADSGVTTAAWQRNGRIYVLAGSMPKAELQQLL